MQKKAPLAPLCVLKYARLYVCVNAEIVETWICFIY